MYQKWRDLSFLHFSANPSDVQKLVPHGLTVDTYPDADGVERAWIGLVPFWMKGVRPRLIPAIPGFSTFPETNVRTYVHREGREPGVWFFSLEAANAIACAWARRFFGLPYYNARMLVDKNGAEIKYASNRVDDSGHCNATVAVGLPVKPPDRESLEFFLIERYLLYAVRNGSLFTGRVFHRPYPLQSAQLHGCSEDLTRIFPYTGEDMKQAKHRNWEHVIYSPGVDVEIFGLKPVKK